MQEKKVAISILEVIVPIELANLLTPTQPLNTSDAKYRLISVHTDGAYYPRSVITNPHILNNLGYMGYMHLKKNLPIQKILAVLQLVDNLYIALKPYLETEK